MHDDMIPFQSTEETAAHFEYTVIEYEGPSEDPMKYRTESHEGPTQSSGRHHIEEHDGPIEGLDEHRTEGLSEASPMGR